MTLKSKKVQKAIANLKKFWLTFDVRVPFVDFATYELINGNIRLVIHLRHEKDAPAADSGHVDVTPAMVAYWGAK